MPATEAVSIANLANDEWTVRSVNRPEVVTVGLWLDDTLREHRAACVAAGITGPVSMQYQLDGEDVDGEVRRVRSVVEWLHETYREAKNLDVSSRPERYALLERLSRSRVMPSEMAVMLGVDVHVAERFAGDDAESRIARAIFHQLNHHDEGTPTMTTTSGEPS
ncbi:hypothetical protein [Curtobacterium sp. MCBD17_026]|uniref:hypothetical protein n=1 Tax=Curtobacterium sp. MCBD17_026 TaxID=2175621 RepID=UPI0015E89013|nr:hypothetical protein [Curtobacterium sp. MCBD17_026]WIB72542.1 hypothetical protein DEI85_17285 [Curtobacterium sp. MCBD17_026]